MNKIDNPVEISTIVGPVVRDDVTAEFFEGTAKGQLLLRRCVKGHLSEPAVSQCTRCASTDLSWAPSLGTGTIVSFAIVHRRASTDRLPARVVLAVVELEEGPWWYSQVADAEPERVTIGARVNVKFCRSDDQHEAVPVFVLASTSSM
jgi:uncharacterized OB-fold protein